MNREDVVGLASRFVDGSDENRIGADVALRPDLAGVRMFDSPIVGVARADDPYFDELLRPGVIGPHFLPPRQWLPEAKSVVSFFLPFTDPVVKGNIPDLEYPSAEWLHGRFEGQAFIGSLCRHLVGALVGGGHEAAAPCVDERFWSWNRPAGVDGKGVARPGFTSNWSERHVAHVAGLGTFSLSKGLITEKGMAGRFGSVITTAELESDVRPYRAYDEYCNRCGACVKRCKFQAITLEHGKDHVVCGEISARNMGLFKPRYGCGKCQVAVPCSRRIPPKRGNAALS
jgi:Uncharacterized Fe-S protein